MDKIKVIYLMGMGRSGGTIIGRILGQLDKSIYVGELRYLLKRGVQENWVCSCGEKFSECKFWQSILKKSNIDIRNINKLNKLQDRYEKTSNFLSIFLLKILNVNKYFHEYCNINKNLFEIITRESKKKIIVDSSRYPTRAVSLSSCPYIDIYVIHLIRDPRGVIFSQQKAEKRKRGEYRIFPVKRNMHWLLITMVSYFSRIIFKKYLVLKYEDFVSDPKISIKKILSMLDIENEFEKQFTDNNEIFLKEIHVFSANENREQVGLIKIKKDEKWKKEMNIISYIITTFLTLPFLFLMGYKISKTS